MSQYLSKVLPLGIEQAIEHTATALKQAGFGIIIEIDVNDTLRKKIGVDFQTNRMLGACNPSFGYEADIRIDRVRLDLMLLGEDGLFLFGAIRMLTAKGKELDRVIGLEMGADDYQPKPFHSHEWIARLQAILRRGRIGVGIKSMPQETSGAFSRILAGNSVTANGCTESRSRGRWRPPFRPCPNRSSNHGGRCRRASGHQFRTR